MAQKSGIPTKELLETVMSQLQQMQLQRVDIEAFLKSFKEMPNTLTEFSAENWHALVDYATVYNDDDIRFTLKTLKKSKHKLNSLTTGFYSGSEVVYS